jgi:hypothetical protein
MTPRKARPNRAGLSYSPLRTHRSSLIAQHLKLGALLPFSFDTFEISAIYY